MFAGQQNGGHTSWLPYKRQRRGSGANMVIVYSSRGKACKNSQTFKITANFMGPANFQASQQLKEESLHFKRRTSMATQHPTATRTPDCNSVEPAFVCRALASCNRATLHGQPHQTLRSQPSIWRPLYATCRAVHQRSTAAAADTRMKATNMSKNVAGFKVQRDNLHPSGAWSDCWPYRPPAFSRKDATAHPFKHVWRFVGAVGTLLVTGGGV